MARLGQSRPRIGTIVEFVVAWLSVVVAKSGMREGAGRLAHFRTTTNNGDSSNSRLECVGSVDRAHFGDFAVLSYEQRHSRGAAK